MGGKDLGDGLEGWKAGREVCVCVWRATHVLGRGWPLPHTILGRMKHREKSDKHQTVLHTVLSVCLSASLQVCLP